MAEPELEQTELGNFSAPPAPPVCCKNSYASPIQQVSRSGACTGVFDAAPAPAADGAAAGAAPNTPVHSASCGRRALALGVNEMSSSSLVKIGTWGGAGGSACDITAPPQRLQSVTIRWGKVIDWIAFSYLDGDGKPHTAGPWGGKGEGEGTETITLGPSEYVTEVAWSVGPFAFKNVECCITSLKLVTNLGTYGPFGHGVDSTHHSLPVLNNGSVVGMFARAGDYLDAIGFYVLPCSKSDDQLAALLCEPAA